MIVYSATRDEFIADVRDNAIHRKISAEFTRKLRRRVNPRELESWRNSMRFMADAVDGPEFPADAGVSIEFAIPPSQKRVDFIFTGKNQGGNDVAVIVELKQWSRVEPSDQDAIVRTVLGGALVDRLHPSYQAWSYAALIEDFNETVRDEHIDLRPCAYLHNLTDETSIRDARYQAHLDNAPTFIERDAAALRDFLRQHVRHGDRDDVMYRIEHGRIRPSKSLADALKGMLQDNLEFVLLDEQKLTYEKAIDLAHRAREGKRQVLIVDGGPGTGKSVIAINLLVELTGRDMIAQYITRNGAPRAVYAARLQGSMTKTRINNLFKGSGTHLTTPDRQMDALIVDEAHRLTAKGGFYGNEGENQIKELILASKLTIFFVDDDQQIHIKDIGTSDGIARWANALGASVHRCRLEAQFRCNGSDDYVRFLDHALQVQASEIQSIHEDQFDFRVFDDPSELHDAIRKLSHTTNKARMVAGYCWDWRSRRDRQAADIEFPEFSYSAQWNLSKHGGLWLIAPDSVEQVGCVHTCQGLELDYVGVIVGPDFVVRDGKVHTDALKRSRNDASIKGLKSMLRKDRDAALVTAERIVKNTYRTLMTRGQKGCYVYCTDEETRDWFRSLISSANAADIEAPRVRFEGLSLPILSDEEASNEANAVRIYDLDVAAGVFSGTQEPETGHWVVLPEHIRANPEMFVTKVLGDSMNRRIPNGAWCLFQGGVTGTKNGEIALVYLDQHKDADTGHRYTVKRYFSTKVLDETGESVNLSIALRPETFAAGYESRTFVDNEIGDMCVFGVFKSVLE